MDEAQLVHRLATGRIAIVGDVMLDHYLLGGVSRISPEAPVPVLHVAEERAVLGGAANVAANVAALGGEAVLVGVTGADAAGEELRGLLAGFAKIQARLQAAPAHPTIVKTRIICGQQQIVRVDRERLAPLGPEVEGALVQALEGALNGCGCVVLSDYGKGVLCDAVIAAVMAAARRTGISVVVDPSRRRFADYAGANYITPNRKELTDATGLPCLEDGEAAAAAAAAIEACGAQILLTRSERGMSLFRAGAAPVHLPAQAREVFDVSGAGDTVVAAFALALAAGAPVEAGMRAANAAAGVVVGKRGTASCSAEELLTALRSEGRREGGATGSAGAISLGDAVALRAEWGQRGLAVGFTNGCFDLLHPGHVSLIRQAAAACDRLIVAINSDASVRGLKGAGRPVQGQTARAEVLGGLKGVDAVVVFDEPTPLQVIQALQPEVLVKGADYREEEVVGADLVKARGGRVLLATLEPGHSTSALVLKASSNA